MKMLRKGEYDLVNISLIGFDPNTGKSYDECRAEFTAERERVLKAWEEVRWWQVWRNIKLRFEIAALVQRLGMPF